MDGADSLKGFGGADTLYGGDGADHLEGMDGNDILRGENGADTLKGGAGVDTLTGGAGDDSFVWAADSDTGVTVATMDLIKDFNFAAGDRINLSAIDADVYTAGNQAFTFIGTNSFSGNPGEINYYYDGGETIIQFQTGTSVDIEGGIRLSGIHTPDASWFVL
jgi:Ca2+-binding RTX toxin-like protein